MLRFLSERRAWVLGVLAVLVILVGLWVWGRPYAKARVSHAIDARLAVASEISAMNVTFRGIELHGVELRGEHGGLLVRIDAMHIDAGLLAALFQGAAAITGITADGIDISVDLAKPGASASLSELQSRLSGHGARTPGLTGSSNPSPGRTYALSRVDLRVVDVSGPLLSITNAALRKEGNEFSATSSRAMLGTAEGDHASSGPVRVELLRTSGVWKLRTFRMEGGEVRALLDAETDQRALALRIQDALQPIRSDDEEEEPPSELDDTPLATEEPSARLFARLTADAEVDVSGMQIESRTFGDDRIERIRDFSVSVDGGNNGWYRVQAGGETSNRGTLQIDLSVEPETARAEGSVRLRRISLALLSPFIPQVPLYDAEAGTLDAQVELAAESTDRISIEGGLQVEELGLFDERIAANPIEHVHLAVRGKGAWLPDVRRLEIQLGTVRMNEAQVLVEGEIERTTEHYRAALTVKLPPTDCNDVVGAIPRDVLGSLSRFRWSGNWSALTTLSLDSRDLEATDLSIRVRNLCTFERWPNWVRVERFQEPFRHRVVEPDETIFQMRTGPGTDNWVAFEDISPFVVPAVISHEDGGFFDHEGFAPWAIRDALVRNLQEGRYVVGASTISMQLAKNLYLQREKTLARKAQEVILTWWLESALTKEQILELYLNVIEYGPGVYGLRSAAAYYFGREPSELSPAEAAYLACMLPSPKRYHVSYERGALSRGMKNRSLRLLEHMAKRERIGAEALAYAVAELDDFQFWYPGDPPPPSRELPPLGAPEEPDPEALDPYEALFVSP